MAVEVKELYAPGADEPEGVVFRCTTTGLVFGPVMEISADDAEEFLAWCLGQCCDPRDFGRSALDEAYRMWQSSREARP